MKNGWPMVPLGEVMRASREAHTVERDQQYPNFGIYSFGRGVFAKPPIDGMATSASTLYRARAGQFVYSRLFAFEGAYGVVPKEFDGYFVSNEFPLFDCSAERLLPEFLRRYLSMRRVWEAVATASTGVGHRRQRVQPEGLLKFPIPLAPFEEQRRIVARIEALAAKIAGARCVHDEAAEAIAVLRKSAAHALFDASGYYPTVKLGDVSDIRSGVTLGRELRGNTVRLPYLRVANVQDGHLLLHDVKEIDVLEGEAEKWRLHRGDLLLTEGGDWDKLGRGTVWEEEIPNCIHQNHIFRVRTRPEDFDPYYLAALVGSPYGRGYFQEASKQTTNLASINQRQLKAFPVPKPPLAEQRRIVAYLDALAAKADSLKSLQQQSAAELEAILPSILDRAFKGELLPADTTIRMSDLSAIAPKRFADLADLVVRAYFDVRDGWSTEYLLSSPDLTSRFVERCTALGAERTPRDLLTVLINARRAGALKGSQKARKFSIPRDQMDLFSFASEMAFRCIQDRLQSEQQRDLTVDAMLVNPDLATQFDQFAARLAPRHEPLQYRWTAITLRKEREFSDMRRPLPLFEDLGRADDVRVANLPDTEGVYCVTIEQKPLFVAAAENLRTQVDRLLDGTKKRVAPEWLSGEIVGAPHLHIVSMPKCTIVEREITRARILREGFSRLNFRGGPLFDGRLSG